ncbi:MAG: glycosyltransferase family 2 protein [Candidatus Sericytochromatia bacterium]|nr:glycosyltransferase family 2 protein [Candidatus Sericytochromatia bacterium]
MNARILRAYLDFYRPEVCICDSDALTAMLRDAEAPQIWYKLQAPGQTMPLHQTLQDYAAWIATDTGALRVLQDVPVLELGLCTLPALRRSSKPQSPLKQAPIWQWSVLNARLKTTFIQLPDASAVIGWSPGSLHTRDQALTEDLRAFVQQAPLALTACLDTLDIELLQALKTRVGRVLVLSAPARMSQFQSALQSADLSAHCLILDYRVLSQSLAQLMPYIQLVAGRSDQTDLLSWAQRFHLSYLEWQGQTLHERDLTDYDPFLAYTHLCLRLLAADITCLDRYPELMLQQTAARPPQEGLISVVIPCYNYGPFLRECVESVMQQDYAPLEIIIVNDGSTDETFTVCQELLRDYVQFPLTVIHQPNSGDPAITRNQGITVAKGEWILCLDADDKINPGFLTACWTVVENYPHLSIVYPRLQEFGMSQALWGSIPYDFGLLTNWNIVPTASLFRKQAWSELGGIKTGVIICEDWDFWIACGARQYFGMQAEKALLYHRVHRQGSLLDTQGHFQKRSEIKADIILRYPGLYTEQQRHWASALRSDPTLFADLKVDISWMPFSQQGPLPEETQRQNRIYLQYLVQDQPAQLLARRTPVVKEHQLWTCHQGFWRLSDADTERAWLDWYPGLETHVSDVQGVWTPTSAAQRHLPEPLARFPQQVLPRFCPSVDAAAALNHIEIEKAYRVLMILEHRQTEQWQTFLRICLEAYPDNDSIALLLFFTDVDAELTYQSVSSFLEQEPLGARAPELVILEPDDFKVEILASQTQPQVVYCEPESDLSGAIWLDALQAGCQLIFSAEIPDEFQGWLKRCSEPEPFLVPLLPLNKEASLYQAVPFFSARWNQSVLRQMHQAAEQSLPDQ